jgi:hypothetical protein
VRKMERCTKDDKAGPSESPCKQAAANCQATSALLAAPTAGSPPWPLANGPALAYAFRLPTSIRAVFRDAGKRFCGTERNRRIRTSMSGWCDWGERATAPPYADFCGKAVCQESNSILTTRIVLLPVSRLPNTLTV